MINNESSNRGYIQDTQITKEERENEKSQGKLYKGVRES